MDEKLKNVLIVDDDDTSNFINNMIIGRANITENIKICTCALEALEYLAYEDNIPELILLDINMPFVDGWEFLDEYFSQGFNEKSRTVICMLSSSIYNSDKMRALSYGDNVEFISKPLTEEALLKLANIVRKQNLHETI